MPAPTPNNTLVAKDESFYCEDIFFLVENVLFKVPRALFNESEWFRNLLAMPQPADQSVEGTVESAPIRLDGYYASDFRCLLKVLLPLQYRAKVDLSADEWKSVLKLASAWEFPALRDAAIEQLSKVKELDLIEKLIIAVRFHIDAWVVDTLNALAKRDAPIGIADAERLLPVVGLEYVLKIGQVREDGVNASAVVPAHNYSCAYCSRSHACNYANIPIATTGSGQSRSQRDYTPVIRSVFGIQS